MVVKATLWKFSGGGEQVWLGAKPTSATLAEKANINAVSVIQQQRLQTNSMGKM